MNEMLRHEAPAVCLVIYTASILLSFPTPVSTWDFLKTHGNVNWTELSDLNFNHTVWPLQKGTPGLTISNLNEYVELFKFCLINLQNFQGIELIGITTPVYITRFDVDLIRCNTEGTRTIEIEEIYFGKHVNQTNYCDSPTRQVKYEHY